jgi:transcriptional antiterminator RfaH
MLLGQSPDDSQFMIGNMEVQWQGERGPTTESSNAKWFVARVKPGREDRAERSLQRLGVEVFQPLVRVTPPAGASRRPVLRPLFGGYLFARFAANEFLEMVRFAPGVSYVVSSGRIPLPVEPEVIDAVRSRLDEDGYFRLQPAHFTPGQRVLIDQGPFAGMVGEVERECRRRALVNSNARTRRAAWRWIGAVGRMGWRKGVFLFPGR